jgi:hypothetical protein
MSRDWQHVTFEISNVSVSILAKLHSKPATAGDNGASSFSQYDVLRSRPMSKDGELVGGGSPNDLKNWPGDRQVVTPRGMTHILPSILTAIKFCTSVETADSAAVLAAGFAMSGLRRECASIHIRDPEV